MGREAAELRGKFTREAEYEIQRQQQSASSTIEEYKRVIDQNLRQSISNKDQEIQHLRDEAMLRDQRQSAEILKLHNMVQQQALANEKLQQLLHESLRVPPNVHPVQTATVTGDTVHFWPLETQTSKAAPAATPDGITQPTNPVIVRDPITGQR